MPLKRRMGRAASREDKSSARSRKENMYECRDKKVEEGAAM